MKLRISHSGIELFLTCAKRYYMKEVVGIREASEDRKLVFGGTFHKGLETWWNNLKSTDRLSLAHEAFYKAARRSGLSPEDICLGAWLLVGYEAFHGDRALENVKAETRLTTHVVGLGGIVDPELELKIILDGEVDDPHYGMEHKTTGSKIDPGSSYWNRVHNSQQLDTYFITAEYSANPLEYVVWDVVRAPAYKRLSATPPDKLEYYQRDSKYGKKGDLKPGMRLADETFPEFEERIKNEILSNPGDFFAVEKIYPDETQIAKTKYDIWATGRLMLEAHKQGLFPRNRMGCMAYNRQCEYYPVCFEGVDPKQSPLYAIKPKPVPNFTPDNRFGSFLADSGKGPKG